jgi:hypothetical protein
MLFMIHVRVFLAAFFSLGIEEQLVSASDLVLV